MKKNIKNRLRTFLYPLLMLHSIKYRHNPRILANSMPKSGTNLLRRLMDLLPGIKRYPYGIDIGPAQAILKWTDKEQDRAEILFRKLLNGYYATSHCFYFNELSQILKKYRIKHITIIRDPRDNCVSDHYYIMRTKSHRLHPYYKQMSCNEERLMASICGLSSEALNGDPPSLDIGQHYKMYTGWLNDSSGLVVKFEDLVGSKGGGADSQQRAVVEKILSYLGIKIEESELNYILNNLYYRKASTFRKGQINEWRNEFKKEHLLEFEKVAGNILEIFGYKK